MDYLLKPVSDELATASASCRGCHQRDRTMPCWSACCSGWPVAAAERPPLAWITASNGRETQLIMLEDVAYFRADNKYTTVVTAAAKARCAHRCVNCWKCSTRSTRQIHRSTIVNMKAVAAVSRDDTGRGVLACAGARRRWWSANRS